MKHKEPKKTRSECRFKTVNKCPQAIWKDHLVSWEMPDPNICVACRLQAILEKKK